MLYRILLILHSWNRWIVLGAVAAALVVAVVRVLDRRPWGSPMDLLSRVGVISADVQLLLGIVLFGVTPWISMFFAAPGEAMGSDVVRFWSIEHGFGMIIAIGLLHMGKVFARKREDPAKKHRMIIIFFGLAMLIMLLTIPWPFMAYGRPLLRF